MAGNKRLSFGVWLKDFDEGGPIGDLREDFVDGKTAAEIRNFKSPAHLADELRQYGASVECWKTFVDACDRYAKHPLAIPENQWRAECNKALIETGFVDLQGLDWID